MSQNYPPGYPPPYQQPGYAAPGYGPQGYPVPGGPVQPARTGQRRALGFGVAGFAVAALIAVILCATGVMPVRGSGTSVDSSAISLPTKLGSYVRYQDARPNQVAKARRAVAAQRKSDRKTAAALSKAYDGAGVAVQTYENGETRGRFSVWVVRASTPGLVVAYSDAKAQGFASPLREVKVLSGVQCIVDHPQGRSIEEGPDKGIARACQRSADGLTVQVRDGSAAFHDPAQAAAMVNRVWDALN